MIAAGRCVSPQYAAKTTGLSVWTVYRAIHAGELRAVKRRSRWLISVNELRRFVGDPVPVEDSAPAAFNGPEIPASVRPMVMEALGSPSRTRGPAHARE